MLDEAECMTCTEVAEPLGVESPECLKSQRKCGHHCNHTWTHDKCCWCGKEFGEVVS